MHLGTYILELFWIFWHDIHHSIGAQCISKLQSFERFSTSPVLGLDLEVYLRLLVCLHLHLYVNGTNDVWKARYLGQFPSAQQFWWLKAPLTSKRQISHPKNPNLYASLRVTTNWKKVAQKNQTKTSSEAPQVINQVSNTKPNCNFTLYPSLAPKRTCSGILPASLVSLLATGSMALVEAALPQENHHIYTHTYIDTVYTL